MLESTSAVRCPATAHHRTNPCTVMRGRTAVTGERGSREWTLLKKGNYDESSSVLGLVTGAFRDSLGTVSRFYGALNDSLGAAARCSANTGPTRPAAASQTVTNSTARQHASTTAGGVQLFPSL